MAQLVQNQTAKDTQVRSLGLEDLEEEMATHASVLPRIIPWTEDHGGKVKMGRIERLGLTHIHCAYVLAKSLQSCPTLCDPMDYSPPGSFVHGIFQGRIVEGLP